MKKSRRLRFWQCHSFLLRLGFNWNIFQICQIFVRKINLVKIQNKLHFSFVIFAHLGRLQLEALHEGAKGDEPHL